MFKIVETIEKARKELTIIPSAWECNGQLFWPRLRADKLVQISDSIPEDNWFTMPCKVKRNYLINYEVAEELERMLNEDETEQEELMKVAVEKKKRNRVVPPKRNICEDDFNSLASASQVRYFCVSIILKLLKKATKNFICRLKKQILIIPLCLTFIQIVVNQS